MELTQEQYDKLIRRCKCSKIRVVEVDALFPDTTQRNTIQLLSNYEIWFVACDGQTVLLGLTEGVMTCTDVLTCLGISVGGDPQQFLNEQGAFVTVVDTNFGNTNLTFLANRAHNAQAFSWNIGGVTATSVTWDLGVSVPAGELHFDSTDADSTGYLAVDSEEITVGIENASSSAKIVMTPTSLQLNSSDGYYFGDTGGGNMPATDAQAWSLGLDANGKVVKQIPAAHFGISIDEGAVVSTGYKGRLIVPYAGTITGWTILETSENPIAGDIVITVSKGVYADYDATPVFAAISGTEKPTLTNAVANQDLSLSTWTTAVAAGDIIQFSVDSAATVEKVYVSIHISRS